MYFMLSLTRCEITKRLQKVIDDTGYNIAIWIFFLFKNSSDLYDNPVLKTVLRILQSKIFQRIGVVPN
jgi:hypothetical protein